MKMLLRTKTAEDYEDFLRIRRLPHYRFVGDFVHVPDEYAHLIGGETKPLPTADYTPADFLFDYQAAISALAIRKNKFAIFADPGLGKTLCFYEFARHSYLQLGLKTLIVSPLMVIPQTINEGLGFYGEVPRQIAAADLQSWLDDGTQLFGITNYEAIRDGLTPGRLGCLILDESSLLKSHYGKWGVRLIQLGRGLPRKLCCTGTPAPNDRIEYANHSVFLDVHRTVNEFLARYFVNKGQTQNRWELKPHALHRFYRDLSHWCIFLSDPSVYGWKDNVGTLPPIEVHIHDVPLSDAQRKAVQQLTGGLMVKSAGGIGQRSKLSQIAKGQWRGEAVETLKPAFIRDLVASWPDESTLLWCRFNEEQKVIAAQFPGCASIDGSTPMEERMILLDWFKGEICTCERRRRIANICGRTTAKTKTNGRSEHQSKERNITPSDAPSTPQTSRCESSTGPTPRDGSKRTRSGDSTSDSRPTESPRTNTQPCLSDRAEAAPSAADKAQSDVDSDFTLITATQQASFGDSSASTAITSSAKHRTARRFSKEPSHTCTCTEEEKCRGRILISKPEVLGFGLNLQVATRQVFSAIDDSYEDFWQCVKRSNRIGSTRPLSVHLPVTELEEPMMRNVLRKADRVEADTREQERLFREVGIVCV